MAIGDPTTLPMRKVLIGTTDVTAAVVSAGLTKTYQMSPSVFTSGSDSQRGTNPTGKYSWSVTVELLMGEFGSGTIHGILNAANGATPVTVAPINAVASETNVHYTGPSSFPELMPLGDGQLANNVSQTFTFTGTGDLTEDDGS